MNTDKLKEAIKLFNEIYNSANFNSAWEYELDIVNQEKFNKVHAILNSLAPSKEGRK